MPAELNDVAYRIVCRDGKIFWLTVFEEKYRYKHSEAQYQDCLEFMAEPSVQRKVAAAMIRARLALKAGFEIHPRNLLTAEGRLYKSLRDTYFQGSDEARIKQVIGRANQGMNGETIIALRGGQRCLGEGAVGISEEGWASLPRGMREGLDRRHRYRVTDEGLRKLQDNSMPDRILGAFRSLRGGELTERDAERRLFRLLSGEENFWLWWSEFKRYFYVANTADGSLALQMNLMACWKKIDPKYKWIELNIDMLKNRVENIARVLVHESTHLYSCTYDWAYREQKGWPELCRGRGNRPRRETNADSYTYFIMSALHQQPVDKNYLQNFSADAETKLNPINSLRAVTNTRVADFQEGINEYWTAESTVAKQWFRAYKPVNEIMLPFWHEVAAVAAPQISKLGDINRIGNMAVRMSGDGKYVLVGSSIKIALTAGIPIPGKIYCPFDFGLAVVRDLNTAYRFPTGRCVLDFIESQRNATIRIDFVDGISPTSAQAGPLPQAGGPNGNWDAVRNRPGGSCPRAVVSYNPQYFGIPAARPKSGGNLPGFRRNDNMRALPEYKEWGAPQHKPPDVALVHELIHCCDILCGIFHTESVPCGSINKDVKISEMRCVGIGEFKSERLLTENTYRAERGFTLREYYSDKKEADGPSPVKSTPEQVRTMKAIKAVAERRLYEASARARSGVDADGFRRPRRRRRR